MTCGKEVNLQSGSKQDNKWRYLFRSWGKPPFEKSSDWVILVQKSEGQYINGYSMHSLKETNTVS